MARTYQSPFTGDTWPDARLALGTIIGLANFLNEKRPRRKPAENHDAAIKLVTDAVGAITGIPAMVRPGEYEGRVISDAYWQAKEAKQKLTPIVDDDAFLQRQQWWGEAWQRSKSQSQPVSDWERENHLRYHTDATLPVRAARLAWYAANLTEKIAAGDNDMDSNSYAHDAALGAAAEMEAAGFAREVSGGVERVWRFVVAAGRMPRRPADDDLLAAFEAALMAGENDFATTLVKYGYGFTPNGV